MNVTKIKYYDVNENGNGRFLARCSVYIDNLLVLHDIKVFDGNKGRYVVMPSKTFKVNTVDGLIEKREDLFHPVDRSFSEYLSKTVLEGLDYCENGGSNIYIPE